MTTKEIMQAIYAMMLFVLMIPLLAVVAIAACFLEIIGRGIQKL